MSVHTQYTEIIQRTEPRPCSHPPAEQQSPLSGTGELLASCRTPQPQQGRGLCFSVSLRPHPCSDTSLAPAPHNARTSFCELQQRLSGDSELTHTHSWDPPGEAFVFF